MKSLKTVHVEVTFGPEVPAFQVRNVKNSLHECAQRLCDGVENKTILSVIKVEEMQPTRKGKS